MAVVEHLAGSEARVGQEAEMAMAAAPVVEAPREGARVVDGQEGTLEVAGAMMEVQVAEAARWAGAAGWAAWAGARAPITR